MSTVLCLIDSGVPMVPCPLCHSIHLDIKKPGVPVPAAGIVIPAAVVWLNPREGRGAGQKKPGMDLCNLRMGYSCTGFRCGCLYPASTKKEGIQIFVSATATGAAGTRSAAHALVHPGTMKYSSCSSSSTDRGWRRADVSPYWPAPEHWRDNTRRVLNRSGLFCLFIPQC